MTQFLISKQSDTAKLIASYGEQETPGIKAFTAKTAEALAASQRHANESACLCYSCSKNSDNHFRFVLFQTGHERLHVVEQLKAYPANCKRVKVRLSF
jgi:hypothetical protein